MNKKQLREKIDHIMSDIWDNQATTDDLLLLIDQYADERVQEERLGWHEAARRLDVEDRLESLKSGGK